MSHACHAIGCARQIPPKLLFCVAHWRMVPANLQRLIWATYVPGQERRKDPSAVYLVAQTHVVAWVAAHTGRLTVDAAVDLLISTIERLVGDGALSVADLETLARHDPEAFGAAAESMRAKRRGA